MILTNYFLKKEIRKLTGLAAKRPHQYYSIDDIKNILLICDTKDWEKMRHAVERLRRMEKMVNTVIFSPSEKEVPTWYSNYLLLCADKDVNLWGFPEKKIQQQFNGLTADIIMNFSGEESLAVHYLYLQHPSKFKAGIKYSDSSEHDFSIVPTDGTRDVEYLFAQLLDYLKTIASQK